MKKVKWKKWRSVNEERRDLFEKEMKEYLCSDADTTFKWLRLQESYKIMDIFDKIFRITPEDEDS